MNLLFRLLWLRLTVGRKSRLGFADVDRLPMRARWTDLDQLRHVNNGVLALPSTRAEAPSEWPADRSASSRS